MRFLFKRMINHITLVILLLTLQIALFIWMIQFAANYWQWNIVFLYRQSVFLLL